MPCCAPPSRTHLEPVATRSARHVLALIGLRCSGKSSLGAVLAERLEVPFVDLDDALVVRARGDPYRATQAHAGSLLVALGEPRFRAIESDALERVLADPRPCVLATGGGVVERAENRARLASMALCVWLDAPLVVLAERLRREPHKRPALGGADAAAELAGLAARRAPWYRSLSALELDSSTAPPSVLAESLLAALDPDRSEGFRLRWD
jgi:shikimate kinase